MAQKPYAAMQALLRDQAAAAAAMKAAADEIRTAADMMQQSQVGGYGGRTPSYGGPNGGRPRMGGNQSRQGVNDPYAGHHKGLSGVRNMVTGAMSNQLDSRFGTGSHPNTFKPMFKNGRHIGYTEHDITGKEVGMHLSGSPDANAHEARVGRSHAINAFSEGGVMAGMKAVPYVGGAIMATEAVNEGFVKFGQERQKNANYQSIYGGSNLHTGISNRLSEEGFKLSQRFSGGLTGADATEAFRGVSGLGVRGDQRSADLNFISSNYKSMGMGVAESLQLITQASKTLNTNLAGLRDGLKSVSEAAQNSGLNGAAARQLYTQNYTAISNVAPGPGAAGIATSIGKVTAGLNRNLQSIDFASMFTDPTTLNLMAKSQSMSPTQFQGAMDTGSSSVYSGMDAISARMFAPFLQDSSLIAEINQLSKLHNADVSAIATALMTGPYSAAHPAFGQQVVKNIQIYIKDFPDNNITQALEYLVSYALKQVNFTDQSKSQATHMNQKLPNPKAAAASGVGDGGGSSGKAGGVSTSGGTAGTKSSMTATGIDPVVDEALQSLKGQNVIVRTQGGQQRVVSIEEAARDYRDQIAKGTAVMADDPGSTVSQKLGGAAETNYHGTITTDYSPSKGQTSNSSGRNSDRGQSIDSYNKEKGNLGTITVTGSPELLKLLGLSTSGNIAVANAGAVSGLVPSPSQTSPTGN